MRMRRKKYLDERLDACGNVNLGWLVDYAAEQRGETQQRTLDVREIFGNDNPVHLEVGCGKGGFAVEAARRNPDINFIAVEMARNVIVSAMELAVKENLFSYSVTMFPSNPLLCRSRLTFFSLKPHCDRFSIENSNSFILSVF